MLSGESRGKDFSRQPRLLVYPALAPGLGFSGGPVSGERWPLRVYPGGRPVQRRDTTCVAGCTDPIRPGLVGRRSTDRRLVDNASGFAEYRAI